MQRTYQWRRDQVDALLTDFESSWRRGIEVGRDQQTPETTDIDYFLGSFVLRTDVDGPAEVFDGLQRLITLTILLAVLRDLLMEEHSEVADALNTIIYSDDGAPRVALGGSDPTLASLIQKRSEAIKVRRGLSDETLRGRLLIATSALRTRLSQWTAEDLKHFSEYVLKHVHCNVIVVEDERIARQIFITTNNRGLSLSEPDILRSQINSIPFRSDVAETVLNRWSAIESGFEEADDYAAFLQSLDFLTRRVSRGPRGLTDLGEYLGGTLSDELIVDWLTDAERFAGAWAWLQTVRMNPSKHDPFSGAVFRCFLFDRLDWQPLGIHYARSLLEALGARDRKTGRHLAERFESLGRFCLLHTILETDPSAIAVLFGRALSEERSGRNAFTHSLAISDQDNSALSRRLNAPFFDDHLVKTILLWIELQSARSATLKPMQYEPMRVLPGKVDEADHWSTAFPELGPRLTLTQMLGNFVLAGQGENEHSSASSFKAVRKQIPDVKVNAKVRKAPNWTPELIEARTAHLAETLLAAFK